MTEAASALAAWGLSDCPAALVATRENRTFRVDAPHGPLALRLHRPGLRSTEELRSELDWMAALSARGLPVPAPVPTRDGALILPFGSGHASLLTWLDGAPMGRDGQLSPEVTPAHYHALGQVMARLHLACDDWTPPPGFTRPAWDAEGLVGEAPLWGRFWTHPDLTEPQRALLIRTRDHARAQLAHLTADTGLIHADLVPENVLLHQGQAQLIDFDDGGTGYRLFDLATVLNRTLRAPDPAPLAQAFLHGYTGLRAIDLTALPLFQTLRALTYVGWIVPRLSEPGAAARSARFITFACRMSADLLGESP